VSEKLRKLYQLNKLFFTKYFRKMRQARHEAYAGEMKMHPRIRKREVKKLLERPKLR
jgi:hypothetical protein